MVPHDERERLENLFKGDSDAVNTFVCTPTLELGVDIGQLDAVLMRNVPPLPANYWQRAGRAGRRHRMAVDVTYCRTISHDRAYFAEPLKLLGGRVDPPAFNLRNELMVGEARARDGHHAAAPVLLAAEGFLPGYGFEVGIGAGYGRDPLLAHRARWSSACHGRRA
jgi:superfamily II DNA/RNA helicase